MAKILDVSDKAVSKWENGQAIPRMETLEKIALTFDTTVDEILIRCNDKIKRVLISNAYGTVLHFQIDDKIVSLNTDDEKWVDLDIEKEEFKVCVYGELSLDDLINDSDILNTMKDKIVNKFAEKLSEWANKQIKRQIIFAKCYYTLTNIQNEQKITVENEMFSAGDKLWILKDLYFSYPKIISECTSTLTNAECLNKTDAFVDFRKMALTSELGISIPLMLIAYPFRKMYFKSVISPKGLMKFITKADYYVSKNEKEASKKVKHPVVKTIGLIALIIVLWFGADIGIGILSVETQKPVLVSADYSTLQYYREEYIRIEELPKDAILNKKMGIEVWTDARIEGYSKADQYFDENKVTEFIDTEGNIYIWFVPDYLNSITDENGNDKEYDDFTEHYVYELKK